MLFLGAALWNELWLKQRFNDNAKVTNTATTPTTPLLFLFYYSIESNFNFSIRFRFISLSLSVPIFGPDQFSTNLMRPISRGGSKEFASNFNQNQIKMTAPFNWKKKNNFWPIYGNRLPILIFVRVISSQNWVNPTRFWSQFEPVQIKITGPFSWKTNF